MRWRPRSISLGRLLLLLVAGALLAAMADVRAAHAIDVKVRVIIERVEAMDDFEGGGDADFYAVVTIDGQEFTNRGETEDFEDQDSITPNWEFSKSIDVAKGTVPISIRIFDEDGVFRLDDDEADIGEDPGTGVNLSLTLAPCGFTGDRSLNLTCVNGKCECSKPPITPGAGKIVSSKGPDVRGDDPRARIEFRIVVEEPPSAPGLRVRCIHSPLWPQPGQQVTITASSLDGALAPRIADNIEIWVNDNTRPARNAGGVSLAHTVGPFPGGELTYGCRVVDDGVPVFTGWRKVSIGMPPQGRAVPVLFTGSQPSRIDMLLIPDQSYAGGATDPTFLADIGNVVQAYYSEDVYLTRQDQVNFWVALDTGQAKNGCESEPPDNWDDDYTFPDGAAIVHRNPAIRDCAPGGERFFSGDATRRDGGQLARVFLHETGHRPFGLADEYCCDGGYFVADPFPNVYAELDDCVDDAVGLGRSGTACREFDEDGFWFFAKDWSVSEPTSNDLMNDNRAPQAADLRRMNWLFDQCAASRC